MMYEFRFFKKSDFTSLIELALQSYQWDETVVGLSRIEFSRGLHPAFTGNRMSWEHTVGLYWEQEKLIACVWNEGNYDGEVFFLFDSKERAQEKELLCDMIKVAKTIAAEIKPDRRTRAATLFIPEWNQVLKELAVEKGFERWDWEDATYMLSFEEEKGHRKKFQVSLPEGYTIIDGNTSPDFYLSNVHRQGFGYGADDPACEHGAEAFHDLRKMPHYDPTLDLCVLDQEKRPVAMAIIWYDEHMPFCELEPLAVVWWERRKGIATAILHEAANRVMQKYPNCIGMSGGDQEFYQRIGYCKREETRATAYHWEREIIISWEKESYDKDYAKEV